MALGLLSRNSIKLSMTVILIKTVGSHFTLFIRNTEQKGKGNFLNSGSRLCRDGNVSFYRKVYVYRRLF